MIMRVRKIEENNNKKKKMNEKGRKNYFWR
jgi:hypothetical protein